jgi:hypothetical protein
VGESFFWSEMIRCLYTFLLLLQCLSISIMVRADVVLDWNALMIDAIRTDNSGPTSSTRNLALLHTAIHDAVNSVLRSHQPYRFELEAAHGTSPEAAALGAAYIVTKALYPQLGAWADDLYTATIEDASLSPGFIDGLELGAALGRMVLEDRRADGSQTAVPYIPSAEPGQWRRTPPLFRPPLDPHWRYVRPFCLSEIEPFLPPPPPPLDSAEYAWDFNEVKALGSFQSAVRTPEQTFIAVFWSDFSHTSMPPGHWHLIAADIARDRGNSLDENARLFALISIAQADAAIVTWEAKYRYNFWRPVTAIHRADEDGNSLTEPELGWEQLLPAPPFPAYPSGHSAFSKASAQVLTRFYGTDAITFSAGSDSLPDVFRTYHSLAECAEEVGMSRIYGGFHFMFDNLAGNLTGRLIGDFASENFLLPNNRLPALRIEARGGGVVRVRLHGRIGKRYVLEESADLVSWTPVSSHIMVQGGVLAENAAASAEMRFYRIKLEEEQERFIN